MTPDDDLRALRAQIDALVDPVKRGGDPAPALAARIVVYPAVLRGVATDHPHAKEMALQALRLETLTWPDED
ncbi:MAG TPA: hypothetical protein VIV12_09925 [Streptosporangiaceae bacterium]